MRWRHDKKTPVIGMARVLAIILGCCILFACATVPETVPSRYGIAVWDLDDLSVDGSQTNWGEFLSAQMIEVLTAKGTYAVVERTRLLKVLEELRLGSSALSDPQTRLKLGKIVGARYMVFGGYQIIGANVRIDVRLVDVETGKIVRALSRTGKTGNLDGGVEAARSAAKEF
jgi:curli biogenesis system outer membrane secretion channel CsgG